MGNARSKSQVEPRAKAFTKSNVFWRVNWLSVIFFSLLGDQLREIWGASSTVAAHTDASHPSWGGLDRPWGKLGDFPWSLVKNAPLSSSGLYRTWTVFQAQSNAYCLRGTAFATATWLPRKHWVPSCHENLSRKCTLLAVGLYHLDLVRVLGFKKLLTIGIRIVYRRRSNEGSSQVPHSTQHVLSIC